MLFNGSDAGGTKAVGKFRRAHSAATTLSSSAASLCSLQSEGKERWREGRKEGEWRRKAYHDDLRSRFLK